jgi:hypothetical protein
VNLGTNRWFIKPEIGVSKALGAFSLELSGAVYFYTTNHDYFGGQTLEQDPVYSAQAHLIYSFGRGYWAAVHGTYDYGGRTTIDGVEDDDVMGNSRFGATLALPVSPKHSVKLYASTGTCHPGPTTTSASVAVPLNEPSRKKNEPGGVGR